MSDTSAVRAQLRQAAKDAPMDVAQAALQRAEERAQRLHGPLHTNSNTWWLERDAGGHFSVVLQFDAVYRSTGKRTYQIREQILEHEVLAAAAQLEDALGRRVRAVLR